MTDVGVRLPAQLTASGRAMLAAAAGGPGPGAVPGAAAFVDRTGRGPAHLPALRRLLAQGRRRGWAVEDGYVTAGFASVAAPVLDHGGRPIAAISTTFRHECAPECDETWPDLATHTRRAAEDLTARIGGTPP